MTSSVSLRPRFPQLAGGNPKLVRVPVLGLIYVAIGIVVAASRDYFENLDRLKPVISAILAIILWPLVLLGVNLHIK